MINWKKRGAKILASFILGYSSGMVVIIPVHVISTEILIFGLIEMFIWPILSGLVVAFPQMGKILNEYGNS
jgi:hypothetical protein